MSKLMKKIDRWIECSKIKTYNLKELSNLSHKKIIKRTRERRNNRGQYIISSTKRYVDLFLYYDDPERYFNDLYFFINTFKETIINEDCKENYVSFRLPSDTKVRFMSNIHFTYNMIMWMPYFILSIQFGKNEIFMPKEFTNKSYQDYCNNKIIEPYKHLTTHNEMSRILAKMYDIFIYITEQYSLDLGLTFNLHDIISKWDDPEFYDINHTKLDKHMQVSEAEDFLNNQSRRYIELVQEKDPDSFLTPLLRVNVLNRKQLKECFINIGFKPTLAGNTISTYDNTNFITEGVRDPTSFLKDSAAARKAAVLALSIDDCGYLARTLSKCASDIILNEDPNYDCGTENYYECTINDTKDLKNMRGRWYLTEENTLRQLVETDYDVIGKTLQFRSPTMCASKNGICATCYGYLYSQNVYLNAGIISVLKLSEKQYQNYLSVKHILDTNSDKLVFNDNFYKFFILYEGYRILFRDDIDLPENYEIWINHNSVKKYVDLNRLPDNEYVNEIVIYDTDSGEMIDIYEENQFSMYLSDQVMEKYYEYVDEYGYDEDGWVKMPLSIFDTDMDAFIIKVQNYEITKPLNELKSFIEKGKELEADSISHLIDKLKHLMECGGIYSESVHIEILARNLVRDKYNITKLPDYSKKDPEYIITSIHNSIHKSGSVTNSLTFERIKTQMKDPLTYEKKDTSFYDVLFCE